MRVTTQMLDAYHSDSIEMKRAALSILSGGKNQSRRINGNSVSTKYYNNVAHRTTSIKGSIKGKELLGLINDSNAFTTSGNIGECKGIKFNVKM